MSSVALRGDAGGASGSIGRSGSGTPTGTAIGAGSFCGHNTAVRPMPATSVAAEAITTSRFAREGGCGS